MSFHKNLVHGLKWLKIIDEEELGLNIDKLKTDLFLFTSVIVYHIRNITGKSHDFTPVATHVKIQDCCQLLLGSSNSLKVPVFLDLPVACLSFCKLQTVAP